MKKLLSFALPGVLTLVMMNSCKENDETPKLTVTGGSIHQTVYADDEKGAGSVSFKTGGAWTSAITEGISTRAIATWVAITPSSGSSAGNYTISVTFDTNYTGADRTATITITSGGENIKITVAQKGTTASGEKPVQEIAVTGVTLNKEATTLTVGDTETLTATVAPDNATDQTVTWKSSAEAIATVDANGKVSAVAPGTATITVTTKDGNKTDRCIVTVNARPVNPGGGADDWGDGEKIIL
jgi:hypothetical protein